MGIYPRNLKSKWYMEHICDHIFGSLEGAKNYIAPSYGIKCEREAFIAAFEQCQKLCNEHDLKPEEMLLQLNSFRLMLYTKPRFFSMARWFHKPVDAHTTAIDYSIDLVKGITERYLP